MRPEYVFAMSANRFRNHSSVLQVDSRLERGIIAVGCARDSRLFARTKTHIDEYRNDQKDDYGDDRFDPVVSIHQRPPSFIYV